MFKMKKGWFLTLLSVLLSFAILGCGGGSNGIVGEDGSVKIGVMLPLTGPIAAHGIDMENAIKMAISEINADGGVMGHEIVTIMGDDGCDPAMGASAASKLVSEEVVAVIGGFCSGSCLPTLKIYGDAEIPFLISVANATTLVEENPGWAFLFNSTGNMQAENAVDWFEELGIETIALVDDGSSFATDLKNHTKQRWVAAGHEVVSEETVVAGEQDFSAIVTNIMAASPEGLYWTAYHAEGSLLVKQLRQAGYEGEIIIADANSTPEFFDLAGEYAEGIYCVSPPSAEFMPDGQKFVADYKAKFSKEPGTCAGLAYDSAYLLVDAIERAGSFDGTAIKEAIAATEQFEGVTGQVAFDDKNTLARSNFVIVVGRDGKWALPN